MTEQRMRLVSWRPLRQGGLLGFATVELPIGLHINECPVLNGAEGVWASLPAKPQLDREGRRRMGFDGKPVWQDVLAWRSRRLQQAFSDRVVALVREAHPEDLS